MFLVELQVYLYIVMNKDELHLRLHGSPLVRPAALQELPVLLLQLLQIQVVFEQGLLGLLVVVLVKLHAVLLNLLVPQHHLVQVLQPSYLIQLVVLHL